MKNKTQKVKTLGFATEKLYLLNIIKHLDMCSKFNISQDLNSYFKKRADLNKKLLKRLK